MKIEPYVLDDRVIIPDYIKKMTREELEAEIKRLEAEVIYCGMILKHSVKWVLFYCHKTMVTEGIIII